jgi:hypothetical protein
MAQQFSFLFRFVMIPQAAWKSGRSGLAATLALLAYALLSPSQADASCGDYVMIGGRHATHEPGSLAVDYGKQGPTFPRCHGPMCSDNSIPPAAPSSKMEVSVEQWAVPGGIDLDVPQDRDVLAVELHVSPCEGFGMGILRPPR